ncbi:hypothetical protein ANN_23158 [Periplaneta americana]|uniref:Uncharacterized protein n=1 Tax=Periplaneta americana TaxID=6978 RepID=A0ABQ8SLC6_PERAM|nr:hypothetical protein ANN_23158 [Periplaneta americana]
MQESGSRGLIAGNYHIMLQSWQPIRFEHEIYTEQKMRIEVNYRKQRSRDQDLYEKCFWFHRHLTSDRAIDLDSIMQLIYCMLTTRYESRNVNIDINVNKSVAIVFLPSPAVASRSKASCLGLALRNARCFESSWGKKFSHEISASVWDRCPPSIVMHLGSYDSNQRIKKYEFNDRSDIGIGMPESLTRNPGQIPPYYTVAVGQQKHVVKSIIISVFVAGKCSGAHGYG